MTLEYSRLQYLAVRLTYIPDAGITSREAYHFIGSSDGGPYRSYTTISLVRSAELKNIETDALLLRLNSPDIAYFTTADLCRLVLLVDKSENYRQLIELELPFSEVQLTLEICIRYKDVECQLRPEQRRRIREEAVAGGVTATMGEAEIHAYVADIVQRQTEVEKQGYTASHALQQFSVSDDRDMEAGDGEVGIMPEYAHSEKSFQLCNGPLLFKETLIHCAQHEQLEDAESAAQRMGVNSEATIPPRSSTPDPLGEARDTGIGHHKDHDKDFSSTDTSTREVPALDIAAQSQSNSLGAMGGARASEMEYPNPEAASLFYFFPSIAHRSFPWPADPVPTHSMKKDADGKRHQPQLAQRCTVLRRPWCSSLARSG